MIIEQSAIDFIKSKFTLPKVSIEDARKQGYDCGLNGATIANCHFSLFQSLEHTAAWEQGKKEGAAAKQKLNS